MTVSGLSIAAANSGGVPVYGYQLTSTTASAAIGTIDQLAVHAHGHTGL